MARPAHLGDVDPRTMRIMAGSAPQLVAAHALAFRELLNLRNGALSLMLKVNGHDGLKRIARMIVVQRFSGIQNTSVAFKMALFANAVARRAGQLRRIHDVVR